MSREKGLGRSGHFGRAFGALPLIGALLAGAAGGGCAQIGSGVTELAAAGPADPAVKTAGEAKAAGDTRSELQKATEYWGKAYAKNPNDPQAALNYARDLKALGEKRQALAVMQQTSVLHASNRAIVGEYGRLALEFDQVSLADRLLQAADDPANPDWKVISARGTVLAKQNRYREAIVFYDRALALAPDRPAILNNLALAHAMNGDAQKAQELLERAAAVGGKDGRINQNLALVLSLQGKYDAAKLAAARNLPSDSAAENVEYLRRIVKKEPTDMSRDGDEGARLAAAGSVPALKGSVAGDAGSDNGWAAQVATIKADR